MGIPLVVNLGSKASRSMEPRRRKRGFAASAAEKLKARQATLLRWQKLLAVTLEYVYSLRWAQKEMVQALAKAQGEMRRWPASPKLQAGFDTLMKVLHDYLVEYLPAEDRRPRWPVSRQTCRHRDEDGKAATKEYKAAGSVWRRCNRCGSRWKCVPDAQGKSVWTEVEPIPYPGGSAPTSASSKTKVLSSRSAGSPGSPPSSAASQTRRQSPTRSRTSPSLGRTAAMELERELPPLPAGPEVHSMSTDHEDVRETANQASTVDKLPTPELSEAEAEQARPDSWETLDVPVPTSGG